MYYYCYFVLYICHVVVHSNHLPMIWYSEKSCIFRSSAVILLLAFPKFLEGVPKKIVGRLPLEVWRVRQLHCSDLEPV